MKTPCFDRVAEYTSEQQTLELWHQSLNRKLKRDTNRIQTYYSDIITEIEGK